MMSTISLLLLAPAVASAAAVAAPQFRRAALVTACASSSPPAVGALIEQACTAADVLSAAELIHAPGPPFAPAHLAQHSHQKKRQSHAANALGRLARLLVGSGSGAARHRALEDPRLFHLASCAAAPSSAAADADDAPFATRVCVDSLGALASLCGEDAAERALRAGAASSAAAAARLAPLRASVSQLAQRAAALADGMTEAEAAAAAYACERLLGAAPDALSRRVAELPWRVVPGRVALPAESCDAAEEEEEVEACTPWEEAEAAVGELAGRLDVEELRREVPFEQSVLMTADGKSVKERRHTAWLADEGIGALAYSGKLMAPASLAGSPSVAALRDALERQSGERFDCVLCNYYPNGEAACKWHTDPEHGTKWARPTSVVSVGETRRFAFRPMKGVGGGGGGGASDRHVFDLFSGDVVAMRDNCNDDFEHAVLPAQGDQNRAPRISLVFKRALAGPDGRRGHGLQGQGRRARRRRTQSK